MLEIDYMSAATWVVIAAFWTAVFMVVYTYILYPFLLRVIGWFRPLRIKQGDILPRVSVTVAAHNEEGCVGGRIENLLQLDYPRDKLEILIGSDGSTDGTADIVEQYRSLGVKLFRFSRVGKAHVLNTLIARCNGEIVVTVDAAGELNSHFLRAIVKPFADSSVGCVTGVWEQTGMETATGHSENRYWRYETWVRSLESRAGLLIAVTGACMAFRKNLYRTVPAISDCDNLMPLWVACAGCRTVQQPTATLYDSPIDNPRVEFRNRVRTVTRSLRDYLSIPELLCPWRYPGFCLSIVSHKLLRWWTPFFLALLLLSSLVLYDESFYRGVLYLQVAGYGIGLLGFVLGKFWRLPRIWAFFANGTIVSLAFAMGTFNVLRGKKISKW